MGDGHCETEGGMEDGEDFIGTVSGLSRGEEE
jgi:hypothetical protein